MKLVSIDLDVMFLEVVLERSNGEIVSIKVFTMFVVFIICIVAHLLGLM
jgi:hypothetical protein